MKKIILAAVLVCFALTGEPTIAPILFSDPSISTAAACDEFHGDFNCTCQQSLFNPCCPWWQPEKCPPPINRHKKDVAKASADYFENAETFFAVVALPTCAAGLILPCVTAGAVGFYANRLALEQHKIVSDPFDPDYMWPYELTIPSAESLGMAYTDVHELNVLIYITTIIAGYGDFIYNTSNRVSSCQLAGDACRDWQQSRVDEGLRQFGGWHINGSLALNDIASTLQQSADADQDWMQVWIGWLGDMARVSDWTGWELWQ